MKHTLWYVPMIDAYGYAYCKFFKNQQEMEDFVESFEDTLFEDEQPIGRQPGMSFEFEVTELGKLEFSNP